MSEFTLGARYGAEDMYRDFPDLKTGDRIAVEIGGVVYTDTIADIKPQQRHLNRWQRILRRLTPSRWRRSLDILGTVAISTGPSGGDPMARYARVLDQMNRKLGDLF